MHMSTIVTGTHVPTTSVKNKSGRNPAAEKKFRLDRRIAQISGEISVIETERSAARNRAKNRSRRALTNLNNAIKAIEKAQADIADARATIASLEASLLGLDEDITQARLAHEATTAEQIPLSGPHRQVVALNADKERVQRRLSLHIACYPEVASMVAPEGMGPGDEGDSDTGDEDVLVV